VEKAFFRVSDEIGVDQALQRGQEARDVGNGILRLPAMVEKLGFRHLGVGLQPLPEGTVAQLAVGQCRRIGGRFERGRQDRRVGLGRGQDVVGHVLQVV
jgi:hypothetical protein